MKIVTIIGARPQIIKASALSRTIRDCYSNKIEEIIVHTGQHYDEKMSEIFFSQLQIPKPKYNLNIGSGSHGQQTSKMIEGIEQILLKENPNAMVIYGDTNSTLAGAIAASKIHIPIVHIEAGLRSFDKNMPEEINRILADNVSTLLFCPTKTGYDNLINEGFPIEKTSRPDFNRPNIYHCGDIMFDNTSYFSKIAIDNKDFKGKFKENFILCTVHRNTNTDDKEKLTNIFESLLEIAKSNRIILPLHPRTKKMMTQLLSTQLKNSIKNCKNIEIIEPVGYLEMIYLEAKCSLVITDSGGVQKEAYFLQKPSLILRPQTEWAEIVQLKAAVITDTNKKKIIDAVNLFLTSEKAREIQQICKNNPIFSNGNAAKFICKTMIDTLS